MSSPLRTPGRSNSVDLLNDVQAPAVLQQGVQSALRQSQSNPLPQGFAQGLGGFAVGDYSEDMLDAERAGDYEAFNRAADMRDRIQQEMAANAPEVRSYEDVNGIGDAVKYGLSSVGQGVASMGPIVGAALAARVGGGALLGRAAPFLGAFAAGHDMEQGEAIDQQYSDPAIAAMDPNARDAAANWKGIAAGAAESIVPGMLGHGFLRGAASPGKTILKALTGEAATEGVQTRLGQTSLEGLRNNTGMLRELAANPLPTNAKDRTEIIDSMIMGGLTGGAVSTPTAASQALANTGKWGLDKLQDAGGTASELWDGVRNGDKTPIELGKEAVSAAAGKVRSVVDEFGNLREERAEKDKPNHKRSAEAQRAWEDIAGDTRHGEFATAVADKAVPRGTRKLSPEILDQLSEKAMVEIMEQRLNEGRDMDTGKRKKKKPSANFIPGPEGLKSTDLGKIRQGMEEDKASLPGRAKQSAKNVLADPQTSLELRQAASALDLEDTNNMRAFLSMVEQDDKDSERRIKFDNGAAVGADIKDVVRRVGTSIGSGAWALATDVVRAVTGKKGNLQNAGESARAHEDIKQILFEELKPKVRGTDGVTNKLAEAAKLVPGLGDIVDKLSEHGLTIAKLAQRTAGLNDPVIRDVLEAVDAFHDLMDQMEDPQRALNRLQVYANVNALKRGLPNKARAVNEFHKSASIFNTSMTPALRGRGAQVKRQVAQLVDDIASSQVPLRKATGADLTPAQKAFNEKIDTNNALLDYAFGEQGRDMVLAFYGLQKGTTSTRSGGSMIKPITDRVDRNVTGGRKSESHMASLSRGVPTDQDDEAVNVLTRNEDGEVDHHQMEDASLSMDEGGKKVTYEMDGPQGNRPYALMHTITTRKGKPDALKESLKHRNAAEPGQRSRRITVEQMLSEKYPLMPEHTESFVAEARRLVEKLILDSAADRQEHDARRTKYSERIKAGEQLKAWEHTDHKTKGEQIAANDKLEAFFEEYGLDTATKQVDGEMVTIKNKDGTTSTSKKQKTVLAVPLELQDAAVDAIIRKLHVVRREERDYGSGITGKTYKELRAAGERSVIAARESKDKTLAAEIAPTIFTIVEKRKDGSEREVKLSAQSLIASAVGTVKSPGSDDKAYYRKMFTEVLGDLVVAGRGTLVSFNIPAGLVLTTQTEKPIRLERGFSLSKASADELKDGRIAVDERMAETKNLIKAAGKMIELALDEGVEGDGTFDFDEVTQGLDEEESAIYAPFEHVTHVEEMIDVMRVVSDQLDAMLTMADRYYVLEKRLYAELPERIIPVGKTETVSVRYLFPPVKYGLKGAERDDAESVAAGKLQKFFDDNGDIADRLSDTLRNAVWLRAKRGRQSAVRVIKADIKEDINSYLDDIRNDRNDKTNSSDGADIGLEARYKPVAEDGKHKNVDITGTGNRGTAFPRNSPTQNTRFSLEMTEDEESRIQNGLWDLGTGKYVARSTNAKDLIAVGQIEPELGNNEQVTAIRARNAAVMAERKDADNDARRQNIAEYKARGEGIARHQLAIAEGMLTYIDSAKEIQEAKANAVTAAEVSARAGNSTAAAAANFRRWANARTTIPVLKNESAPLFTRALRAYINADAKTKAVKEAQYRAYIELSPAARVQIASKTAHNKSAANLAERAATAAKEAKYYAAMYTWQEGLIAAGEEAAAKVYQRPATRAEARAQGRDARKAQVESELAKHEAHIKYAAANPLPARPFGTNVDDLGFLDDADTIARNEHKPLKKMKAQKVREVKIRVPFVKLFINDGSTGKAAEPQAYVGDAVTDYPSGVDADGKRQNMLPLAPKGTPKGSAGATGGNKSLPLYGPKNGSPTFHIDASHTLERNRMRTPAQAFAAARFVKTVNENMDKGAPVLQAMAAATKTMDNRIVLSPEQYDAFAEPQDDPPPPKGSGVKSNKQTPSMGRVKNAISDIMRGRDSSTVVVTRDLADAIRAAGITAQQLLKAKFSLGDVYKLGFIEVSLFADSMIKGKRVLSNDKRILPDDVKTFDEVSDAAITFMEDVFFKPEHYLVKADPKKLPYMQYLTDSETGEPLDWENNGTWFLMSDLGRAIAGYKLGNEFDAHMKDYAKDINAKRVSGLIAAARFLLNDSKRTQRPVKEAETSYDNFYWARPIDELPPAVQEKVRAALDAAVIRYNANRRQGEPEGGYENELSHMNGASLYSFILSSLRREIPGSTQRDLTVLTDELLREHGLVGVYGKSLDAWPGERNTRNSIAEPETGENSAVQNARILMALMEFSGIVRDDPKAESGFSAKAATLDDSNWSVIELNKDIVEHMRKHILAGLGGKKALQNALVDAAAVVRARQKMTGKEGWVKLAQSRDVKDSGYFFSEAQGTGWCTASSSETAHGYLSKGDMWMYYEDGRPEIGMPTLAGKQLAEDPRGRLEGQRLSGKHQAIAEKFLTDKDSPLAGEGVDKYIDARARVQAYRYIVKHGELEHKDDASYFSFSLRDGSYNFVIPESLKGYRFKGPPSVLLPKGITVGDGYLGLSGDGVFTGDLIWERTYTKDKDEEHDIPNTTVEFLAKIKRVEGSVKDVPSHLLPNLEYVRERLQLAPFDKVKQGSSKRARSLPNLAEVGWEAETWDTDTPKLRKVGVNFSTTATEHPELTYVGGRLMTKGIGDGIPHFPKLEFIGRAAVLYTVTELPSLTRASGGITAPNLVSAPLLKVIGGKSDLDLLESAPSLEQIMGELSARKLADVPKLFYAGDITATAIVVAPRLTTIASGIPDRLKSAPKLSSVMGMRAEGVPLSEIREILAPYEAHRYYGEATNNWYSMTAAAHAFYMKQPKMHVLTNKGGPLAISSTNFIPDKLRGDFMKWGNAQRRDIVEGFSISPFQAVFADQQLNVGVARNDPYAMDPTEHTDVNDVERFPRRGPQLTTFDDPSPNQASPYDNEGPPDDDGYLHYTESLTNFLESISFGDGKDFAEWVEKKATGEQLLAREFYSRDQTIVGLSEYYKLGIDGFNAIGYLRTAVGHYAYLARKADMPRILAAREAAVEQDASWRREMQKQEAEGGRRTDINGVEFGVNPGPVAPYDPLDEDIPFSKDNGEVQGFVYGNKAYLVADSIKSGKERGVFMHEVGVHLGGMENVLGEKAFQQLADQVTGWADQKGTLESKIAKAALRRAGGDREELIAYAVEEAVNAGVRPTAESAVGKWLAAVFKAFKAAVDKLLGKGDLKARDLVDLAHGVANKHYAEAAKKTSGIKSNKQTPPNDIEKAKSAKLQRKLQQLRNKDPDAFDELMSGELSRPVMIPIPERLRSAFSEYLRDTYGPVERESRMAIERQQETQEEFLQEVLDADRDSYDDLDKKAAKDSLAESRANMEYTKSNKQSFIIHKATGNKGFAATHDSPHKFDGRFDWRKHKHKGEGFMSFGAGTYLSTAEGVHKNYKDSFTAQVVGEDLAELRRELRDEQSREAEIETAAAEIAGPDSAKFVGRIYVYDNKGIGFRWLISHKVFASKAEAEAAVEKAYDEASVAMGQPAYRDHPYIRPLADHLAGSRWLIADLEEQVNDSRLPISATASPTYQVTVNAEDNEILDWNKLISEQPPAVRKKVRAALDAATIRYNASRKKGAPEGQYSDAEFKSMTGERLYSFISSSLRREIPGGIDRDLAVLTSELLQENGFVGHRYNADSGKNDEYPNYVIYDDSRITTNAVMFNKQTSGKDPIGGGAPFAVTRQQVTDEVKRITGRDPKFDKKKSLGEYDPVRNKIRLSILHGFSAGVLTVGYHESLHSFFNTLSESVEGTKVRASLMRISSSEHIRKQLTELLKDHPDALGQIESDPEERVAYAFQFWAAGKFSGQEIIKLSPEAAGLFNSIAKFFRELFKFLSDGERIEDVFNALYDGKLAKKSAVASVLESMNLDTLGDKLEAMAGPLADLYNRLLLTAPERLRGFGSAAMDQLADMYDKTAGMEHGELPFLQQRERMRAKFNNEVRNLVGESTAAERGEALRNLQAMKAPSSQLEHDIADLLARVFKYMKDSKVKKRVAGKKGEEPTWENISKYFVKGYFPRHWDASKIAANEQLFKDRLLQHGQVTAESAATSIKAIQTGDGQIELADDPNHVGFTPYTEALTSREWTFINPSNAEDFVEFQSDDLFDIMDTYIGQAVHRAEFAKYFGNDGKVIKDLVARAGKDLTSTQKLQVEDTIKALNGTLGAQMNPRLRALMSGAILFQNVVLLPLTIFSQFIDTLGVALRSGDLVDAYEAFKLGMKSLFKGITRMDPSEEDAYNKHLAETLGLIDEQNAVEAMGRASTHAYMSKFAKDLNRKFFRLNGMQTWNDSMRIAAMVAGERFIMKNVDDGRYMRELNLSVEDVMPMPDGRLAVTKEQMAQLDPSLTDDQLTAREQKVQQAIFRFVDSAVLRPTAAQRPVWGSDPHHMMMIHLKQFTFSFQKTFLSRMTNEMAHGNHMPAAVLAAYIPMTIASLAAKSLLTGVPIGDGSLIDLVNYGILRSGVMGRSAFGTDAVADLHRGQLPGTSFLGPAFDHLYKAMRWTVGDPSVSTGSLVDRSVPLVKYFDFGGATP